MQLPCGVSWGGCGQDTEMYRFRSFRAGGGDGVHFPLGVLPEGYGKDMEMYRIRVGAQWVM